jgi:hypothetical protein
MTFFRTRFNELLRSLGVEDLAAALKSAEAASSTRDKALPPPQGEEPSPQVPPHPLPPNDVADPRLFLRAQP